MTVTKYPIDYDTLKKGDYITPEQVQDILGKDRESKNYGLHILRLKQIIEDKMEERGTPVTAKVQLDGIHILMDNEASEYRDNAFDVGLRKSSRAHAGLLNVDIRNLTEMEKAVHENAAYVNGKTLQAAMAGRKEAHKALPHKRNVPGLPPTE